MKKVVLVLAAALMVAPVMAGVTAPSPVTVTVLDQSSGLRGTPIYADLVTALSYLNNGSASTYPLPVGDDIHAIAGGTITSFTMGYYAPTVTTFQTFNLPVAFYTNTAGDFNVPGGGAALNTAFTISGLPGGAIIVSITGVSIPVGADFWFEESWAAAVGTGGPLLTLNSGGTVGYSHSWFSQTGTTWGLGTAWADFVLAFNVVPEPATICLMALGGLGLLIRRR